MLLALSDRFSVSRARLRAFFAGTGPMYGKGSVTASHREESAGTVGKWPDCLPLCLWFVILATKTARRMIPFPDDKARFVFLFYVNILSIFGIRGGRILLILGNRSD